MHHRLQPRIRFSLCGAVIAGVTAIACCIPVSAAAASGPVSPTPASGTPALSTTSSTEQVVQLVQCGGTMYAVGTFTEIHRFSTSYTRNNIFSFSATAPYKVTSWNPDVNGTVNTIAFNGNNCSDAYIGGSFTSIGGTSAHDIAEISTSTGAVVPGFKDNANGEVYTLAVTGGHLLAGGHFTSINDSTADPFLASLNPSTGKDDGFADLHISGSYSYPGVHKNSTVIYNQQLSPNGNDDLIEGLFTSVGGAARQQIAMINVSGSSASVTGWSSPQFDGSDGNLPNGYAYQCSDSHPAYIKAAAWSPDSSTVYIATTGFHPWNETSPNTDAHSLCDVVAAFPATQKEVTTNWINYSGCWSFFSVAADSSAVYAGGHEEYANNPNGCKTKGSGAVDAPGMGGFNPAGPSNDNLLLNKAGTAGLYSRARGLGADDMLVTNAGLWIASDNFQGSDTCGGVSDHAGICFLPYPS